MARQRSGSSWRTSGRPPPEASQTSPRHPSPALLGWPGAPAADVTPQSPAVFQGEPPVTSGFDEVHTPRLVLAGAGSTTGTTTPTPRPLAALPRPGVRVTPLKVRPHPQDAALLAKYA